MGKANKWIINFLLGRKKEERNKKKKKISNDHVTDSSFPDHDQDQSDSTSTQLAIVNTSTPKILKLRWSFGRKSGKKVATAHKISLSVESIDTSKLQLKQLITESDQAEQNHEGILHNSSPSLHDYNNALHIAATKIQAVFRSHLARRALHALRGLVKIQALVRGHLVRKQTAATLRGMHALMAIQVRARVHRIQMVEDEEEEERSLLQGRGLSHDDNYYRNMQIERLDMNLNRARESMKSKSDYINQSQIARIEHELTTYYSRKKRSISKGNPFPFGEDFISSQPNSPYLAMPKLNPAKHSSHFDHGQVEYLDPLPNYMSNTKSSRAKARSQSEPKQRPGQQPKDKKVKSMSRMNLPQDEKMHNSSEILSKESWFMKLYRQTRSSKERNHATNIRAMNSHSDYYDKSHIAFESPLALF